MTKEERRQRAEKARQNREREANLAPGERLEAVKLLLELEK